MWETYYTPSSVDQALRLLAELGAEARIVAGGTDLLVELQRGTRQDKALVDVTRLAGLDTIWQDEEGQIQIAPLVTHNQAVASGTLEARAFPLAQACWQVGTPALRNRGTITGNLVTASPANDTITALWALDAQLTLRSVRGERRLTFGDFYQGVRRTALAEDEMVTAISFPALAPQERGVFVKLGLRRSHAIALVNAAAVIAFEGEVVRRARIALGSVAPTIVRATEAEQALRGGRLREEEVDEAAELAAQAAAPIDDVRGGAAYRRETVGVLVRRALRALRDGTERASWPTAPPMLWGTGDGRPRALAGEGLRHGRNGGPIECTVNGEPVAVRGASGKTLLSMLRDDLGLTGTKEGCAEGECGACTVWMDGMAVLACLVAAPRAHGTEITTIEALAQEGRLHPVQQAFLDEGAVQCGYCTPGFVMSGAKLLQEIPRPSREQIVAGLEGNLCRCTGYYKIVRAIERAAERREP
jgi:xanthine dehydrogenase iron-sulfur cluster and FAD-binding subunit A